MRDLSHEYRQEHAHPIGATWAPFVVRENTDVLASAPRGGQVIFDDGLCIEVTGPELVALISRLRATDAGVVTVVPRR